MELKAYIRGFSSGRTDRASLHAFELLTSSAILCINTADVGM